MEAAKGRLVRLGGLELRFLADERDSAGELVMFELSVPPQARVPAPHYHDHVDEVVYGLGGTLTTRVDGRTFEVRSGDAVLIPRGSVHHHANLHDEAARALVVLTPGTIGRRYFEEMADAVNSPDAPDPGRVMAIMRRHGLMPA